MAHDLTHVQLLIQKLENLLRSLFMNISCNVATIRRTSNTDDIVSPAALKAYLCKLI